jgi:hypothetical protein
MEENWIESTMKLMDAVRHELERVRWLLYDWHSCDIHDDKSGLLEPGIYEDMRDRCEAMMGTLESLLEELNEI